MFLVGDVQTVQWMKERFSLKDELGQVPNVIQATINDSPEMLEALFSPCSWQCRRVNYTKQMVTNTFGGYSALDIAIAFGLSRCEDVLRRFQIPSESTRKLDASYINLLFSLKSKKYSQKDLLKMLISNGYDVNTCAEENGHRLPVMYMQRIIGDVEMTEILLSHGAKISETHEAKLGCPPRLLAAYIYHNVDISTDEGSVITGILDGGKAREEMLYLVLDTAHTVCRTDRDKLSELCSNPNFFGVTKVRKFLNETKPLTLLCRNSIRKHYAHKIHEFLDKTCLPTSIRHFLSLKEDLQSYMELPVQFGNTDCKDLSDIFLLR